MKRLLASSVLALGLFGSAAIAQADDYTIDSENMHAFINFRIQHLGYSWLYGRFNDFAGTFSYDEAKPEAAKVEVTVKTTSVDSNHAERDKHIRSKDFFEVETFPEAKFVSTAYKPNGDGTGTLTGDLTLKGVTKPLEVKVHEIGAGKDPWGGFRRGFEGTAKFALADYGISYDLGPASKEVELILSLEGVKK
ncbi:YceI family protein [uncultured Thiothrix sp.]|uniref:YceI family protein n=1 Tax=uncultured Thiothrix sp. TaxID=223185 RepID=UPI00260F3BD1|nr:YceI family protein [uncultured Thiothrix sp.]HMT93034.1 YceI family protein [Thiolinea sp.]